MTPIGKDDDMEFLRIDTLRTVLSFLLIGFYAWGGVIFITHTTFGAWFLGPLFLVSGVAAAYLAGTGRPRLAAGAACVGVGLSQLWNLWNGDVRVAPYMLTIAISLVALMFGIKEVVRLTLIFDAAVLSVGALRLGYPLLSADLLAPVFVISVTGAVFFLLSRNLYITLHWLRNRTLEAQRNEDELRQNRAELARTLKSMKEAYTRLEHVSFDLARAYEAAEEARQSKQQFVTSVSHELRTPLNVILAFSEMMYMSPGSYGGVPLPAQYRGDMREIYRSSIHLLHLVDDILDLSKIEVGKVRIDLQTTSLPGVIEEALELIHPLIREKKITLNTVLPQDLPDVLIDRTRIQQVLINLLNNARRFTSQGKISVEAAAEGDYVRITVSDTGIGIPTEEQGKIFKEFEQIEVAERQGQVGTGLGLAISKRFVEMHGGTIWVESDGIPGHETRFSFTLPIAGVGMAKINPGFRTRQDLKAPKGKGRVLLLLDDDAAVKKMLEHYLDEYQVIAAADPAQAAELAQQSGAQAVVLNLVYGQQAWRQLEELRQSGAGAWLPVILCPLVRERQLGRDMGALDYLVKPVSRSAITRILDDFGDRVRRILLVDDDAHMERILAGILQPTGREYELVYVPNGREALQEMEKKAPDLVFLDLVMPEVDGYQFLRQVRENAQYRQVPVVVLTAQMITPEEERQAGGKMLCVSRESGFTNHEVLEYLRAILGTAHISAPPG